MSACALGYDARVRAYFLSASLLLATLLGLSGACSDAPASQATSTTGSGAAGGAGGNGGGGSGGGAFPCPASGVDKGPWSLHIDGTSAVIRWEACRAGTASDVVIAPEAGGAEAPFPSVETVFEVTETYEAPLTPGAPPDAAGTYYMHDAALTGLAPATCYVYHLAAEPERKGRFCTARAPGDAVKFMAIGDTNPGLGTYAEDVLAQVIPEGADFTIHGGDVQYYSAGLETWASWFPAMQPMLSQGGFFPAIGNHESETATEYAEHVVRYFGGAGFDSDESYYRFQSGGVWFFSLDTEIDLDPGSAQGGWLAAQLADAKAQPGFRFSVVYFHRPFVTCGDSGDNPDARAKFEPIFLQNGVTLIVQAHMHGYERFELGELTYITSAGGGGVIGNVDENISRPYCVDRVASGAFRHAVIFDVTAGQLAGTAIDDQGVVRDSFTKVVP